MFGKKYVNDLISRSAESAADQAWFRKIASAAGLGLVGAGLLRWMASSPALAAQAGNANAISDATILNFALNLEYLEAEFYSYAVNGEGLPESLTYGTGQRGPVAGGHAVQFGSHSVRQFAKEIARDLANLFTAGKVETVQLVLRKLAVVRAIQRAGQLGLVPNDKLTATVDSSLDELDDLYRLPAIAKYEDRYVVPKAHAEAPVP